MKEIRFIPAEGKIKYCRTVDQAMAQVLANNERGNGGVLVEYPHGLRFYASPRTTDFCSTQGQANRILAKRREKLGELLSVSGTVRAGPAY